MKQLVKIPLSLAAAGVVAFGFNLTVTSDEWTMIGSDRGVDITNTIGTYDANGTTGTEGCANNALISAWRFYTDENKWRTTNCTFDTTSVGYEEVPDTAGFEGVWVHASSTGGTTTVPEVLAADQAATSMSVTSGWNLMSMGDEDVTFATNSKYSLFLDTSNSVYIYKYDNGTWEVYSPNSFTSTTTTATGLKNYEGFWAYVASAKTYDNLSTDSSGQIDLDTGIHDNPDGLGAGTITVDDFPVNNMGALLELPPNRFAPYSYATPDLNVTNTASGVNTYLTYLSNEANATGTTNLYLYYIEEAYNRLAGKTAASAPTTGDISATSNDLFQYWYDIINGEAYIASAIKGSAAATRSAIMDLNATLGLISSTAPTTAQDYLQKAATDAADYYNNFINSTTLQQTVFAAASLDESNTSAVNAANNAYTEAQEMEASFNNAKTAYQTIDSETTTFKNLVYSTYDLLVEANASQSKQVVWAITTPGVLKQQEVNKTITMKFGTGVAGWAENMGSAQIRLEVYDSSGDNIDAAGGADSTTYLPITTANANLATAIMSDINSTLGDVDTNGMTGSTTEPYANYVYVSGSNANEINITGRYGVGNFDISLVFTDVNNSNYEMDQGSDYNLTIAQTYIAPETSVKQIATFTVLGDYQAGDELNITGGSGDSDMSAGAQHDSNYNPETRTLAATPNFLDRNITFKLEDTNIDSSSASTTRSNVATLLASYLDSNESNLTASASSNVVTVTLSSSSTLDDNDSNNSSGTAYDLYTRVNGIDFSEMLRIGQYAKTAATALEDNVSAYVAGSTGYTFENADDNVSVALNAIESFVTNTGQVDGTVYQDSVTRLNWHIDAATQATYATASTQCSSSNANQINGWRLPTLLEVVSLYDGSTNAITSTVKGASGSVFQTGKYVLTSNTDSNGDYYAVSVDGMTTMTWDGTTSNSNIVTPCVADFYDNGDSSYRFNDFYYYTDAAGSTNRLVQGTSNITDSVLSVYWEKKTTATALPAVTYTDQTQAAAWCSALGMSLPSASQLRSLNLYDMKARYDNNYASGGLNRTNMFPLDFNGSDPYWTSTDNGSGSYYVIDPTMALDYNNMFNTVNAATGGTASRVICVKPQ